jgi:prolyl oligopeptidase
MRLAARFGSLALAVVCVGATPLPAPPTAAVIPVADKYFGTTIVDPYRWMENLDNPTMQSWLKAQDTYTRSVLSAIPGRKAYSARLEAFYKASGSFYYNVQVASGRVFAERDLWGETPKLVAQRSIKSQSHVLFDPAKLGALHSPGAIHFYAPNENATRIVIGVSHGGSESITLRIIDASTGHNLPDRIDRAWPTIFPSWLPGNKSFFYARLPKLGSKLETSRNLERAQVFVHTVGANPDGEKPIFGYGLVSGIAATDVPFAVAASSSKYVAACALRGVAVNCFAASLADIQAGKLKWRRLGEAIAGQHLGDPSSSGFITLALHGDALYAVRLDSQNRTELVRLTLGSSQTIASARVILSPSDSVIENIAAAVDALYVATMRGGISYLERIPYDSNVAAAVRLPIAGSLTLLATDPNQKTVIFGLGSWLQEDRYYDYDPASNELSETNLVPPTAMDSHAYVAEEVKARSAGGTNVPLSIIHKRGMQLNGSHPTELFGYGAYGISLTPQFGYCTLPWLERGGVCAISHIRGGGEFGEPWHLAAMGPRKQRSIADFIACAQYLIAHGYTSPAKLGIEGESAGGIVIGNAIVQRPVLFAAAVDGVGATDLLRFERTPNGKLNIPEMGSITTSGGFRTLYSMSPYQHVVDGTRYPAVLLETGLNDTRVPPWMVAKMAARLQAATRSRKPILLRVDYSAGHFSESILDQEVFLLWQTGDPAFQPATASQAH